MIGICGIAATVVVVLKAEGRWLPLTVLLLYCVAGIFVAITWNRKFANSHSEWGLATALGIVSISFVFCQVVPLISKTRSAHANAAQLLRTDRSLPVVYFDQDIFAATMHIPKSNLCTFNIAELDKVSAFLDAHPQAILVTSRRSFSMTKQLVAAKSDLISTAGGRNHVHMLSPRADINLRVASNADQPSR